MASGKKSDVSWDALTEDKKDKNKKEKSGFEVCSSPIEDCVHKFSKSQRQHEKTIEELTFISIQFYM